MEREVTISTSYRIVFLFSLSKHHIFSGTSHHSTQSVFTFRSTMTFTFARRIEHAPASFLGELFRVSADPSIISFAGGLPVVCADRYRGALQPQHGTFLLPIPGLPCSTRRPTATVRCGVHRGAVPAAARHPRDCRRDPDRERVAAVPRSLREDLLKPRRPGGHGAAGIPRGDRGVLALRAGLLRPCRSTVRAGPRGFYER